MPRFDHFCVWINNAVGEENYRSFLSFLVAHASMLSYGGYASLACLLHVVERDKLFSATFYSVDEGRHVPATRYAVFRYLSYAHVPLVGLAVLSCVMGVVMWCFLLFHVYISGRGMTTNEYFKWRDIRSWHRGAAKRYAEADEEEKGPPLDIGRAEYEFEDGDVGCVTHGGGVVEGSKRKCAGKKGKGKGDEDSAEEEKEEERDDLIHDPGPMPRNIYDLGPLRNWGEVIWPRSERVTEEVEEKATGFKGKGKRKGRKKKGTKGE